MIRALIRYLQGYVKIRVSGYSPERFLNLCCYHGIRIWGLTPAGNAYEMYLTLHGFRKLRPFVRKTHTKIRLTERHGFPFFLQRYRKRKLLFAGILLGVCLLRLYSAFIWDIHFQGNERWPDETLVEFLKTQQVEAGMRKKDVDCSGIVKAIRKEYNNIVWVSASIDGSRLKVQIKEKEDTFEPPDETEKEEQAQSTDLVATTDGVITKIITRSGVPQVHEGDAVKTGDLLVLGRVDVLNDSGEVIDYQYRHSDADIYADTKLEYEDHISRTYQKKNYDGKERRQYYLRINGVEFCAGILKNSWKHSEMYTLERQVKLGENFYLPVSYGIRKEKSYTFQKTEYTKEELQEMLSLHFRRFCEELEQKGIQICENNVKIQLDEKNARALGTLYLNQKITEEQNVQPPVQSESEQPGGNDTE